MIDLKPYGAFVEHTIRPMLHEFSWVLEECDLKNVDVNGMFNKLVVMYIIHLIFDLIKTVAVTGVVCAVLLKILAS